MACVSCEYTLMTQTLKSRIETYTCLAVLLVIDIIIAVSLCRALDKFKEKVPSLRSALDKSMFYLMNVGVINAINTVVAMILYAAFGSTLIYWAFSIVTVKLYPNCYMALLNGRQALRLAPDAEQGVTNPPAQSPATAGQSLELEDIVIASANEA